MPVTAKLSRKFYETFGDEIANELVEWFNQVDATYRADLLQINELNFSRFDARLEQRTGELGVKLEQHIGRVEAKLVQRVAELDVKWNVLDAKLEQTAQLVARLDQRLTQLEAEVGRKLALLNETVARRAAETKAELINWMFVFWAGTLLPLGGLILLLVR